VPGTGCCYGYTVKEAVTNLKEACELYLEDEDAIIPAETSIIKTFELPFNYAKTSCAVGA